MRKKRRFFPIFAKPFINVRYFPTQKGGVKIAEMAEETRLEGTVPLIQLVITLIVVGVLLWAMNTYIPMDPKIRNIINIVVVVAVVLWLLRLFGVLDYAKGIRVGAGQTGPLGGVCSVLEKGIAPVSSSRSDAGLLG